MSCRRVRGWLHRDAVALDDTQRLILDDHLAACERCRGDRRRLLLVREVGAALPVPPAGSRAYSRAIARALLEDTTAARARAPVRRWLAPVTIAALVGAAAAVAIAAFGGRQPGARAVAGREAAAPAPLPSPVSPAVTRGASASAVQPPPTASRALSPDPPASSAQPPPRAPSAVPSGPPASAAHPLVAPAAGPADVVEDGALSSRSGAIARGAEVPADAPLRAVARSRVRLASLQVVIAASAELRWRPAERTVLLDRGTLEVETLAAGAARVVTERFEVELDDAALTVNPSSVRVRRGAARIVDRAHRPLAHLTSGGSWRPSDAGRPARAAEQPSASGTPAIDRLGVARAQLAAQDYASAERSANDLLAAAPGRSDEAEARILLAEVAQARGALDLAVTRYLRVATTLPELPEAESALYAAARIELRRSRASAARALLARYLDRYPQGRYADDVRRELAALP